MSGFAPLDNNGLKAGLPRTERERNTAMMKKTIKPVSLAAGIALAGSLAGIQAAHADTNPFGMTALSSGYMTHAAIDDHAKKEEKKEAEGKCGEGKCGGDKKEKGAEGKCGEGKCGGDKDKKKPEGKCGTA
jgi:uncharacterized low-complexity protein